MAKKFNQTVTKLVIPKELFEIEFFKEVEKEKSMLIDDGRFKLLNYSKIEKNAIENSINKIIPDVFKF